MCLITTPTMEERGGVRLVLMWTNNVNMSILNSNKNCIHGYLVYMVTLIKLTSLTLKTPHTIIHRI